jgi:hypothetical protein
MKAGQVKQSFSSFPEFSKGGAKQAITNTPIQNITLKPFPTP